MTNQEALINGILNILKRHESVEKKCIGKQDISFDDSPAESLTPVDGAKSALIQVVADATAATPTKAATFYLDGSTPTATTGIVLGSLERITIDNRDNLLGFKIIGIEAGKTHTLRVLYFNA